ncbi:magnesium/cobalt transporter CorA [Candidatus Thiothrix sp. Deng01]|uniref:Magnesium transport protein CorA n=1 Tax=Candidatus Thiothrix phosphatis TaxID=3112415 RepID=A0ABU6CV51_9GAMM|nr:magnesium/cobalt transporter CorA [Candidatus Thiothrix sp. Deng01]MEB4590709.1 magnesium/cobalt transporter CorA [Candidatus Thiothrix sp. Deng01]
MLRLFSLNNGLIRELPSDDGKLDGALSASAWIDMCDPEDAEHSLLESLLRTDLPESEDVEEIEFSARFFVDHSGLHVHSLFMFQDEGRHNTASVAFILQDTRLITIRDEKLPDFRLFRLRAKRGQITCHDAAELLVTILEHKVENHADYLEDIHHELEEVSHTVLEEEGSDLEEAISELARLEDSNGKIRLCLMDTQRGISFLLRHLRDKPEQLETLREIMRDIEGLMSHTTFLFDKINFLMASTQGFINIQQNQIIKIFSIAAVVFLPPTLVASIYGMNFVHMPELQWLLGYPWAIGLMIISGIAPYLFFKHKGWL